MADRRPSTSADGSASNGWDRWTVVSLVVLVAIVGLFVYDYAFVRVYLIPQWEWKTNRSDWLFLGSLFILWVLFVVPVLRDGDKFSRQADRLRSNTEAKVALGVIGTVFLLGTVGPLFVEWPRIQFLQAFQPPLFTSVSEDVVARCVGTVSNGECYGTFRYPLGTDGHGFGILGVIILGARVATYVGVVTAALMVPLGTLVGSLAGYFGGVVDAVLMRYVDVQQTIPAVVIYILLILIVGKGLFLMLLVFGLFSWGGIARTVRSEVLQVRNEEFVLAGKSLGGPDMYLLSRHVVPNVTHSVIPTLAHQVSILLLTEAALAYLGLGDIDQFSWGRSIAAGLGGDLPMLDQWWVALFPALALAGTVVAVKVAGDNMRDVMDPQS